MAVLLDTDHISILQRGEWPAVDVLRSRLKQLPVTDVRVSIVSFQEQVQGWFAYVRRARKPPEILKGFAELLKVLRDYCAREVLPFDEHAMNEFLALQQQRVRIGADDLRIAAIAKANGLKLLSRNLRDFRLVPGLDVEDWAI